MNKFRFYLYVLLLFSSNIIAQVTIGSGIAPNKGAILDLKQNDQDNNSTKGILFPRVVLSDSKELYPMFGNEENEDPEYTEDKNGPNRIKIEHKGLIVYNLSDKNNFNEGLHIWNGTEWRSFMDRYVSPPFIEDLLCEQAKLVPGKFEEGKPYEGGILTIPYIGGNGMDYTARTYTANGLTFELVPGRLNVGQGILYYKVTGISISESIELDINFLGQNCTVYIDSDNGFEIKTIEYVRSRTELVWEREVNEKNTLTTLGNLQIRYSGRDGGASEIDLIQFRTLEDTHITYQYTKHGDGGNYLYRYNQIKSTGQWLDFGYGHLTSTNVSNTTKDINLASRDIAKTIFVLHNTREVYRLTVNANSLIQTEGDIPGVPARISFFLEKLE